MTKLTYKIDGVPITIKSMELYDQKKRFELKALTNKSIRQIVKEKRDTAPVKTGGLKKSIGFKKFSDGFMAFASPKKKKGNHRHLVAYGTSKRRTRKGANRGTMPSNDAFANAGEQTAKNFEKQIEKILNGGFQDEI